MPLCTHLDDYAVQLAATEADYRHFVQLVDTILELGPGGGRAQVLAGAIDAWRDQDARLRGQLVELVRSGRVRLPRRMAVPGLHRHAPGTQGTIVCATCRRAVPRLRYSEWQFAHNGVVSYRGNEFDIHQAVAQ